MSKILVLSALVAWAVASCHAQDGPPPPPPPDPDEVVGVDVPAAPDVRQDDLQAQIAALKAQVEVLNSRILSLEAQAAEAPAAPADAAQAPAPVKPSNRSLLLPDISLIGNIIGHVSTDETDDDRNRISLAEAEIGIQGYVYPGVKADAFIVGASDDDFSLKFEEAWLTAQKLGKGLNGEIGLRKLPFGRTNQLHPHSWLYATQPMALSNLVASESIAGQGAALSYLIPTGGSVFLRAEYGWWNDVGSHEHGHDDGEEEPLFGTGAGFRDKVQTLRLWGAGNVSRQDELELGGSLAWGEGAAHEDVEVAGYPDVTLTGVDLSYRYFGKGSSRTLVRGEYINRRHEDAGETGSSQGYYGLVDYRPGRLWSYGLRYDWSESAHATSLHESGVSGWVTRHLNEASYLRLQLTQGQNPLSDDYTAGWLQWVWGIGPHTHNLE